MTDNRIVREYQNLNSTNEIAKKLNLDQTYVKTILISALGKKRYLKIAHQIGAKCINDRIRLDPIFKVEYSKKMKNSVSKSLLLKMREKKFRMKWLRKSKKASKKGTEQIKKLLLTDKKFLMKWVERCKIGGKKVVSNRRGIHDPLKQQERKNWSLLGLKRTGRKFSGPKGERMYNSLEINVAELLSKNSIEYEYEMIIDANNKNKFYSLDFVISGGIVIETTYWSKIDQKARELSSKFKYLKENTKFRKFLLVTKPDMLDRYKRVLPHYVIVLTLIELEHFIAGQRGVRF